jgi:predicted DCC family thiol-disulfide oxidoreductase YuxK
MDSQSAIAGPAAAVERRAWVLYDGHCRLCVKSVDLVRRLDWLKRLRFVNVRNSAELPDYARALPPERLLEEMHLLTPDGGRVYHGFAAFRWMAWRLPPLWPVAPFLYVPGIPWLGQRLYLWVARNRFHLVPCHGGVCTLKHSSSVNQ